MRLWRITALILLMGAGTTVYAHPLAPALLEITETEAGTYSVLWRLSTFQRSRQPPQPEFPAHCGVSSAPQINEEAAGAVSLRWTMRCALPGLAGTRIGVSQLDSSGINVILRLHDLAGEHTQSLLDARRPSYTVPDRQTTPAVPAGVVALRYLELGIEHLLLGPDHLLFLLGLLVLVRPLRHRLLTLTAFTLGHSVTLSLAALDLISVRQAPMELGIALSLVVLARELLRPVSSALGRWPPLMALVFGLLHGLGFAGALRDIGLPTNDVFTALLAFNVGIELGQLAVLLLVLAMGAAVDRLRQRPVAAPARWTAALPAYLIGAFAAYWCIERAGLLIAG